LSEIELLSGSDRYDEAVEACDRALSLEPDDFVTRTNKGRILISLGWYDEARSATWTFTFIVPLRSE
jgi:Flp pilus assembly protein TadD